MISSLTVFRPGSNGGSDRCRILPRYRRSRRTRHMVYRIYERQAGWAHAGDKAIGGRPVKTDDENPIVAQLWGSDPASMEKLAKHCAELGYQGIDINMGCPDSSAVKSV